MAFFNSKVNLIFELGEEEITIEKGYFEENRENVINFLKNGPYKNVIEFDYKRAFEEQEQASTKRTTKR